MDHIAIMNKSWGLIPKILSGEKTIESRWYKNRISPWDKVQVGDTIYFKNSCSPVTARAKVSKVLQFSDLDRDKFADIVEKYADNICLKVRSYNEYYQSKRYCVLIFLSEPKELEKPFYIHKTGYGCSSAWMCVENIEDIIIYEGKNYLGILQKYLSKEDFEFGKIEYTSGNYDEKGLLIRNKLPTVTTEIGEIGIIKENYYLVMIFRRTKLKKEFLTALRKIDDYQIYGFIDFMRDLEEKSLFDSDLINETYIQIQFNSFTINQEKLLVEQHKRLRKLFQEYMIFPINQIHNHIN